MSYTPADQLLEPSLTEIVIGIDHFVEAANNRLNTPSEWKDAHLASTVR